MNTHHPYRIALIGAGQIGSRHLQGLVKLDGPVDITVIDPSKDALQVARDRYYEVGGTYAKGSISFLSSVGEMGETNLDLAIIATTAGHRAAATRELLGRAQVQHILFEKVLFQSVAECEEINDLLQQRKINAWVNCARRQYPSYIRLKEFFPQESIVNLCLQGGEWGLASNGIHFLDLMAFFTGQDEYTINIDWLDPGCIESKRKGMVELTGTLHGRFRNGSEFVLHSRRGCDSPHRILIQSRENQVLVDETQGRAWLARKENNWAWEHTSFDIPFQSQLTQLVAAEIIGEKRSRLPSFEESSKLHISFLEALCTHLTKYSKETITSCPIT